MSTGARAAARLAAAAAATLALAGGLVACGGDDVVERPAHRPISVIYVAGDPEGPWQARTEGLADGVKLAIAERDGLIGARAASAVVVPIEQRDGTTVSAGIGGGRILRDSRAIAVLGTYTAPQFALSGPQLNGGELSVIQFGSGFRGLTGAELPGEPARFEPSGRRYALRGVVSDQAVAERIASLRAFSRPQIVPVTGSYEAKATADARARAKEAAARRASAREDGDSGDDLPSTSPALTNPSPQLTDAERLAGTIAETTTGMIVTNGVGSATRPTVLLIDPTEADPDAAVRSAAARYRGPLLVVDGADRDLAPSAARRSSSDDTLLLRRTVADAASTEAQAIRERERKAFGRDRGDAVVAGYRAASRGLELATAQPDRTIDRVAFAKALTGAAPSDRLFPADAAGDATLGRIELLTLRGGRWVAR